MKKALTLTLVVVTAVLFTACAKQPVEKSHLTGEKVLKQSPLDERVYYYVKKGTKFENYNKVAVSKINFEKEAENVELIDDNVKEQISTYFTESLSKAVNNVAVNNPGKRTLKLEIAIEKTSVVYEDLKFYNYIPVSLVVKGITRGTGIEDKDALIVIAMRLTDVQNQEIVALAIDSKKIENINRIQDVTFEKVKPLLDAWVAKFQLRLEDFSKGVYKELDV